LDWLLTTLAMYRRVFGRAFVLVARNWPMAGTLFVYAVLMSFAWWVALRIGALGGFVIPIVGALCAGSFLHCVEAIVRTGKATLQDVRASAGAYFADVLGVMFALWVFQLVGALLASSPLGPVLALFSSLLIFVFFNAVPELIYLGRHSTMELLGESYRFISRNWIEWLPVTLAFLLALPALWNLPSGGAVALLVRWTVGSLAVCFAMVVRGLLFLELEESSRRSRIFRHRAEGG
jgi:hypothetical protein